MSNFSYSSTASIFETLIKNTRKRIIPQLHTRFGDIDRTALTKLIQMRRLATGFFSKTTKKIM
ncbi:hypothetical protein PGB90_002964 [Kerria lacca]